MEFLESQPQRELHDTCVNGCPADGAKSGCAILVNRAIVIGIHELCMVKDIEELRPELNIRSFPKFRHIEMLDERKVCVVLIRSASIADAAISETRHPARIDHRVILVHARGVEHATGFRLHLSGSVKQSFARSSQM